MSNVQGNQNQGYNGGAQFKYCRHCGAQIPAAAVVCTHCGCQVEELHQANQPNIVINNANTNTNTNMNNVGGRSAQARSKWVALLLCFFLGYLGAHKFYEGKNGMGILYLFTVGFFGIGWCIDFFALLFKPNPYYVR